jgi:hypothetical protein
MRLDPHEKYLLQKLEEYATQRVQSPKIRQSVGGQRCQ